jgi:RNA polymerase sigma-70 factor, ECF subfamily
MKAATLDHETSAQRATGTSAPALVLVRAQERPHVADSPPRTASESMNEVWRIHGTVLMRFALKLTLGDKHRAEDIVQETLLRAWRHPEVVDGHAATIRSWLFTVTRHVAIDMWRTQSRHDDVIEEQPVDRPGPVEPIEQAMTAMHVRAALAQLTPEHRQVIVEVYYLGRSVTEIAKLLRIPEGTVKSRTYYGLRHLRRLLSDAFDEQPERTQAPFPRALTA